MTFGIKHEAASVLRARFDDAYFDLKDELQDANDIRMLEDLKLKDMINSDTSHQHLEIEMLEDLKLIYNEIIEDTIERGAYLQSSINDLQAHTDEMNHFIQGFKEK